MVNLSLCRVIEAANLGTFKDQFEVELLANVSDVDDLVDFLFFNSISNSS